MDLDQLKQILELVREHELAEFEVEQGGLRMKVRRDWGSGAVAPHSSPPTFAHHPAGSPSLPSAAPPALLGGSPGTEIELAVVKSPIVGTFYRAAEPGAPPFVDVGTSVKKGQVLCIIEAMKLMNEIDCEYEGEIVTVYVENGQAVQYGERLFAIRTK